MLGIIYLLLAGFLGYKITEGLLVQKKDQWKWKGSRICLVLPSSFGVGTLLMTWAVYVIAWMASVCAGAEKPLVYGNLVVMAAVGVWVSWEFARKQKKLRNCGINNLSPYKAAEAENTDKININKIITDKINTDKKIAVKELVFFSILLAFITYMMFYVFFIKDGVLYSGFTVYGDYAPHTAMMRSFSLGNNFPTQYPHFGGEDIKYHFMFQFLTGNLEYLGLRLDLAYNLVSVLSLLGFLMILYEISLRISGSFWCGSLAALLFFFRSGNAFFRFAWEHFKQGNLWETLKSNTAFIGYTANEDWGLWNFNVYLNQRHLAFGLLLAGIAIWVYMDWLDAGISHTEKGWKWLGTRFFTREAWLCKSLDKALILGVILGLSAFWNGAALIGCLLILMGFGIFSDGKLDYAVTALVAVFFSVLQSKIFIRGQAMSPSFVFGFLADNKDLAGVLQYLFQMSGIFFLGLLIVAVFMKRRERVILVSFFFPLVFAFTVSLTPDINVNHKYIMISYAFLTIFWAWAIGKLFCRKWMCKIAAVLLALCLTATGIYDFAVILKGNGPGRRVAVKLESSLTDWLAENLDKNDLLLTPEYSMHEVTMSGVMMYLGWPYYAWSAGYDTYYRAEKAVEIYTASDSETIRKTVEEEGITYILYQEGMEFEQHSCREDVIKMTYPKVFESEDGTIRIYRTER